MVKSCLKNSQVEGDENQFEKSPSILVDIPISRTPLDTIPDPSQFSKEFIHEVLNQSGIKDKLLDAGVGAGSSRMKFDSANNTPARSVSRTNVGQLGAWGVYRVSRRISSGNGELVAAEVPHFELVEDPSFWDDHNVQVDYIIAFKYYWI
ncbi:hypothetical protein Hanom_Chr04g00351421 [Helianthus anomalus]